LRTQAIPSGQIVSLSQISKQTPEYQEETDEELGFWLHLGIALPEPPSLQSESWLQSILHTS